MRISEPMYQHDEAGHHRPFAALTTQQAATYLGLAVSTLNKWRCHGGGPEFLKLGRSVRYLQSDLDAFLEARRVASTAGY